jgi:hypothetical protein
MTIKRVIMALGVATVMGVSMGMAAATGVPIGYVKNVSGEVQVITAGESVRATVGSPVAVGSTLKTAANASVGLGLRDNTLLSLGPNTEFTLREYAFEPGEGKLSLVARLTRGTLDYVSGVIAKLRPEAVSVETPTGTLGVRGTHFAVKVEGE